MFKEILQEMSERDTVLKNKFLADTNKEQGPQDLNNIGYRGPGYYLVSRTDGKLFGPFDDAIHANNYRIMNDDVPADVFCRYIDHEDERLYGGSDRQEELERRKQLNRQ
jgi:hypothetical protein